VTGDPFVHLHVASGYSMQYGANHPADLVARAAEHGMTALALTDRDGLYGAVKFALACRAAGVRPIFGVDLAMAPAVDSAVPRPLARSLGGASRLSGPPTRRVPARGGASVYGATVPKVARLHDIVFDSSHHRHRWDRDQQRYWSSRRTQWESRSGHHWSGENWSGFDRRHTH